MDPVWHGKTYSSRVKLNNPTAYSLYINCFKDGEEIEVVVRKKRKKNSRNEQNYYRGVVLPHCAKCFGLSTELSHGILQEKFFKYYTEDNIPYIRSTKLGEWTTKEWEEKIEQIRQWIFDLFDGYRIPLPNEVDF